MNSNYHPLGFLFYPFILSVLSGVIYLIWTNNPALMDQLSLVEKQRQATKNDNFLVHTTPISENTSHSFKITTTHPGLNIGLSRSYPDSYRIQHRFRRQGDLPPVAATKETWTADDAQLLIHSESEIKAYHFESTKRWELKTPDRKLCVGLPALAQDFLFHCTQEGKVLAIYRSTGRLAWVQNLNRHLEKPPILTRHGLLVSVPTESAMDLVLLNTQSGKILHSFEGLPSPAGGQFCLSDDHDYLAIATLDAKLLALSIPDKKRIWSLGLPQSVNLPPVCWGQSVLTLGEDGHIGKFGLRAGSQRWTYELGSQPKSSMTVLPDIHIGVVVDKGGYLHVMDLKAGKRKWRYNMQSNSAMSDLHAVRFSEESRSKMNMSAESLGWSFWGACGSDQLCAFDPIKGYMIRRYELPGKLMAPPYFVDGGRELIAAYISAPNQVKFLNFTEKDKLDLMQQDNKPEVDNTEGEN